jgi:hypothetical protein
MVSFYGCIFDGFVHALDLLVRGQVTSVDARVFFTDSVKDARQSIFNPTTIDPTINPTIK